MSAFEHWTATDVLMHNARVAGRTLTEPVVEDTRDDPESALHDYILEYCHSRGWLAVHSRMDKKTTTALGVSDFIIITPHTVLFVEAKRPGRKCTPKQRAFLAAVSVLGWPQAVVHNPAEFDQFIRSQR